MIGLGPKKPDLVSRLGICQISPPPHLPAIPIDSVLLQQHPFKLLTFEPPRQDLPNLGPLNPETPISPNYGIYLNHIRDPKIF